MYIVKNKKLKLVIRHSTSFNYLPSYGSYFIVSRDQDKFEVARFSRQIIIQTRISAQ